MARRRIVITPVYNESKVIADVVRRIAEQADLVIAVNDGSRDATSQILAAWRADNARAIVIESKRNNGASGALRKGYVLVSHLLDRGLIDTEDLVIEIDSDGQHDPAYIGELCARFESSTGVDVVLGRRDFSVYPAYKIVGNWGLTLVASILGGYRYRDVESNFRVMPARRFPELLRWFGGYRYSGAFEVGIILGALGLRTDNDCLIEVPLYRAGAGFLDGFHVLGMGIKARWRLLAGRQMSDVPTLLAETLTEVQAPPWYPASAAPPARDRR